MRSRRRVPPFARLCLIIGIIAAAAVLLLFGLSFWTLLIITLMIACPAVIVGALLIERKYAPRDFRSVKWTTCLPPSSTQRL